MSICAIIGTTNHDLGITFCSASDLLNESATSSKRMKVLEQDLRQTLETVERLQEDKKALNKIERQRDAAQRELEQLQQTVVEDKLRIDNGMQPSARLSSLLP